MNRGEELAGHAEALNVLRELFDKRVNELGDEKPEHLNTVLLKVSDEAVRVLVYWGYHVVAEGVEHRVGFRNADGTDFQRVIF